MIIKKGIEIRLYPNKGQRNFINKMIGATRVVYNTILFRRQEYYKEHKKSLLIKPTDLYTDYPWMKELDSQGFCSVYVNLMQAYDNFFTYLKKKKQGNKNLRKIGLPEFKSKHSKSGSYRNTQPKKDPYKLIDLKNYTIFIPKIKEVKFKGNVDLDRIKRIRNLTIKRTNTNKYFCLICCDYEVPDYEQTGTAVGLDLGIKDLIITSDGQKFENKKFYRNNEKQIKHLQRNLSRKQKGSKNHEKARLKLAIAHEKLSNRRKDYIQKLTTKLVKDYSVICIEDLNVSGMLKNHKLAKSIADCSFSMIRSMLDYKCRWYDRKLVVIDRWEPTSKTCNCCGHIMKNFNLGIREWICPSCGTHHDRDINAARNILKCGLNILDSTDGTAGIYACEGQEIALAPKSFSKTCLLKQESQKLVLTAD